VKRGEEEAARIRARAPEWIVLTPEKLSAAAMKMVEPMRTSAVGVRVDTPRARHGIEESREDEKDDDVNEAGGGGRVGGGADRADEGGGGSEVRASCCESVQKNGAGSGKVELRRES